MEFKSNFCNIFIRYKDIRVWSFFVSLTVHGCLCSHERHIFTVYSPNNNNLDPLKFLLYLFSFMSYRHITYFFLQCTTRVQTLFCENQTFPHFRTYKKSCVCHRNVFSFALDSRDTWEANHGIFNSAHTQMNVLSSTGKKCQFFSAAALKG